MPVMRCTRNGQAGWKYGDEGYCYLGTNAKAKAARQGRAIRASQGKRSDALSPESEILKRILADRAALGKGKKLRRPPTWRLPISVENRYRRELISIVNTMERVVDATVVPHLAGIVAEANQYTQRGDAWPTDLNKLFNDATITIGENTIAEDRLASAIGNATADYNDTQWRKIVKSVLGVNVVGSEPWLSSELDSFAQENVALIKSIKDDSIRDIEGMVQRGIRDGQRHETIAKSIKGRFQVTRRRAQLIARDQVSKLNGQLTGLRQTDLGVTHYIWRTSDDERVRPSHRDNDDKRFAWNKPPSTGHPGHDINCRCWAEPDFESMFGELAETEVPTTSLISSVKVGGDRLSTRSLPNTIEMTGPDSAAGSWVQTSTLNRAWKRYGTGYVKPGGNDLKKRRALVSYLKRQGNGARLDMPVVRLDGDNIEILKGRETFALLRDLGVTQVPVRVSASNVTRFSRTFGLARQGNTLTLGKVKGTTKVAKGSAVPKPVKPPKPKPKPAPVEPPPTTVEFVPPRSTKEAKKQLEGIVADTDYVRYMDIDAATYRRFQQPKAFSAPGHRIKDGVVVQPGSVTLESATLVNRKVAELQKRAGALGIPRLRGVRYAQAKSYNARMGDGVLDISIPHLNDSTSAIDFAKDIRESERYLGAWKERRARALADIKKGINVDVAKAYVQTADERIVLFTKKIKDLKAGKHPSLLPSSQWRKGDKLSDRPFSAGSYWQKSEKFNTTIEHEFGHHIHQTLDVKTRGDLLQPVLEKRLIAMRTQHGTSGTATRYGAGERADFKAGEWFAENYALWQRGRKDLVDDALTPLLKELDKRAGVGL